MNRRAFIATVTAILVAPLAESVLWGSVPLNSCGKACAKWGTSKD